MEFNVGKGKKTSISKIALSILAILIFYLGIRVVFGNSLKPFAANMVNNILISYTPTGTTLSEISIDKLKGGGSITSNLIAGSNIKQLDGGTGLQTSNPKILAMRKFLLDYDSPMYGSAETFVKEAEKYGLDWRLVASISGVESAFGNLIPSNTNNGWGWRGGPAGAYSIFSNWNEGIKTVTRGLALGYGITLTPFDIEQAYCPPCYANPSHAWANGVTRFMSELKYYLDNLEKI